VVRPLTIVMYHYVRELKHSRFPDIKGLTVQQFRGQVEYMQRFYTFVTVEQVLAYLKNKGGGLPKNAAMLTFDDGYIDHFTNVFPILDEKGIQGCFFPIGKAVSEHRVLDVNKIHFVLASVSDKMEIVRQIWSLFDELRPDYELESNEYYYQKYALATRYDPPEVVFIKKLLQRGLAEGPRTEITDRLFGEYVGLDEAAFAKELYMNADQIRCMAKAGMYISSHGYEHRWLDTVPPEEQQTEIESSLRFLRALGCNLQQWSFNYPYGAHNESLVSALRASGAGLGFTTKVGIADLDSEDPLLLSRLNTNDLPKDNNADANEWTLKVIQIRLN
jgi:peptidoglycan/xylan/chitin deacetylase (PgdA/CDA1 family)